MIMTFDFRTDTVQRKFNDLNPGDVVLLTNGPGSEMKPRPVLLDRFTARARLLLKMEHVQLGIVISVETKWAKVEKSLSPLSLRDRLSDRCMYFLCHPPAGVFSYYFSSVIDREFTVLV